MRNIDTKKLVVISFMLLLVNMVVSASLAFLLDPATSLVSILTKIITTHVLSIPMVCAVLAFIPTHFSGRGEHFGSRYLRGFLVILAMTYALFFGLMFVKAFVEFWR